MADVGFPAVLDLTLRPCLVVGGGRVAHLKITGLLVAQAAVTVISPEVIPEITVLVDAGQLTLVQRPFRAGDTNGFHLITSATGIPTVDAMVSKEAETSGRLINAADDPAHCNVLLPSVARRGPVTVAVSTTGMSPALAAWLRRRIEATLPDGLEESASILRDARQELRAAGISTEEAGFSSIVAKVVELVATGHAAQARTITSELIAEQIATRDA